ncbi:hypothetical protein TNIN_177971 [Trichonephila inaurata madagascariensis]|uniref:Uncharacterized protein n=1 Tax=Trichonephila inaurata madagascariensis TaxID=2747483 RepID=A0A8X6XXC8_9ARAC|nr:hypothetical protein TNIN_177971 [Trichonephila inaurata madagascariensis]
MTASCPAILINHHPNSINESGHLNPLLPKWPGLQKQTIASSTALLTATIITETFLFNQEAPSPHRRQHPRTLKPFMIKDGGLYI